MGDGTISLPPHIVVFPSPVGWPLNSMFDLAELLCLSGADVTLLLIPYTHTLLFRHIHVESRLNPYPNFRLQIISDGLPPDHSRSDTTELLESLESLTKPIFRDFLASGTLISDERRPLSCIISDGIMSFVYDVANEIHVPVISAFTLSPSCLWVLSNLSSHIGAGEVSNPIGGNNEHLFTKGVPAGLEGILTGGDLASMCRSDDFANPFWKHLIKQIQELPRAHGLILNAFKALDGPTLSRIQSICANLYAIGPIQAHLWARQEAQRMSPFLNEKNNNCMIWLDTQKPNSIFYVNIETHNELTRAQVLELWHGLVNSEKGFLWVRKPESIVGESRVPQKIRKATKERGFIVDWASDVHVLAHKAVGGFLTDCRWESILESIVEGVPTICFPWSWDEKLNSRFINKAWKLGMDLKERWDRNIMEKTIRDVSGLKGELTENANKMRKLGRKSVSKGGSSYAMLDHLVEDIRLMRP